MGVTRFPNGVEVGDGTTAGVLTIGGGTVSATPTELNCLSGAIGVTLGAYTAGKKLYAGTVIVGATGSTAFKPSGISSANFAVASPYGPLSSTAGTVGGFVSVAAAVGAGGTVTITAWDLNGTASSTAGTATYLVIGT